MRPPPPLPPLCIRPLPPPPPLSTRLPLTPPPSQPMRRPPPHTASHHTSPTHSSVNLIFIYLFICTINNPCLHGISKCPNDSIRYTCIKELLNKNRNHKKK